MDIQQGIALIIVGVATVYLIRNFVRSARAFFSSKSGRCGGGCGKCAFAAKENAVEGKIAPSTRPALIPLTEIRRLSDRPAGSARRDD